MSSTEVLKYACHEIDTIILQCQTQILLKKSIMIDTQEKFKFSYTNVTIKLGTSQDDVQLFLACTVVN